MKKAFLFVVGTLLIAGVSQANTNVVCQGASGTLAFEINQATRTISFSDIGAFGQAQIQKDAALPMELNNQAGSTEVSFEYDWYYTAQYQLSFAKGLNEVASGQSVELSLNGADGDGSFFNDVRLTCEIK